MCDAISGFDQKSTLTVINVKMNDCCVYLISYDESKNKQFQFQKISINKKE